MASLVSAADAPSDVLVLSTDSFSSVVDSEVRLADRCNDLVPWHRLTLPSLSCNTSPALDACGVLRTVSGFLYMSLLFGGRMVRLTPSCAPLFADGVDTVKRWLHT